MSSQSSKPQSPCVNICVVHPETRLCTGCNRSIEEISRWGGMSAEERHEIMRELPNRGQILHKRRGGRAARLAKDYDESSPSKP